MDEHSTTENYRFYTFQEILEDIKRTEQFEDLNFNGMMKFEDYKYTKLYSENNQISKEEVSIDYLIAKISEFLLVNRVPKDFEFTSNKPVQLFNVVYDYLQDPNAYILKNLDFIEGFDELDEHVFEVANTEKVTSNIIMVFVVPVRLIQVMQKSTEALH